jgi:outer membrane autotransporter protein
MRHALLGALVFAALPARAAESEMSDTHYSSGYSLPAADREDPDFAPAQIALSGSYRFGGGAYVAGLILAEKNPIGTEQVGIGEAAFDLGRATIASRYNLRGEAGVSFGVGNGLLLTPRTGLSYASYSFGGYREGGDDPTLELNDPDLRRLEARLGAQLASGSWLGEDWLLVRLLQADYVRTLAGADEGSEVRLAAAPDQDFLQPLGGHDDSWAEIRGGVGLTNGLVKLGAGLGSSVGRADYRDDRAIAELAFRF